MTVAADIASLLGKLQERITRTASETRQNTDAISTLRDDTRIRTGTLAEETMDLRTNVREISDVLEVVDDRVDELRGDVRAAKTVADKREAQQTLRDQSNVQSLVNLRDSTEKAFKQVAADVAKLDQADKNLSIRITDVEKFTSDLLERAKNIVRAVPVPAPVMPSDHVWVNKKLTGVYDTTTDLEQRLSNLEYRTMPKSVAPGTSWEWKRVDELEKKLERLTDHINREIGVVQDTPLCQRVVTYGDAPVANPTFHYCGFQVRFKGSKLIVESKNEIEIFYLPLSAGEIVKLENRPYGLQISLKRGDQYALCGGITLQSMQLVCLVTA